MLEGCSRGDAPAMKEKDAGHVQAAEGKQMGWGAERVRATLEARWNAAEEEEHKDMLICKDRGKEKGGGARSGSV